MNINLELPLNSTSFGQISIALLREFHARGIEPCIFPIGGTDFTTQNIDQDFGNWITRCIQKAPSSYKKSNPCFRLWHLNGSYGRISDKTVLLTFYECDSPTSSEINIVKNTDHVLFSSQYTTNIFKDCGLSNVSTIKLGFDKYSFSKLNKPYLSDKIVFNILGKLEHRKRHEKLIKIVAKNWGGNHRFVFQFAIYNPFFSQDDNKNIILRALDGKGYFNMQFLGFMPQNALYNDYLNSGNIVIGMSGGENWSLGDFHSVALGKHAIIHNAAGYKEWANSSNSVLVNPSCKIPAYDGAFFRQGDQFNQGNFFDWDEEDFIAGFNEVVRRYEKNPVNEEGLKLQSEFTLKNTVDQILSCF